MKTTSIFAAALLVAFAATLALSSPAFAQATAKDTALAAEIKKLDEAERLAVLANDVPAIEKYWAADMTVNAPNNQLLKGGKGALDLVRNGILDYASFERVVEDALVYGDTVILMGSETIQPRGKAPQAGQTVHRRFTNIWIKRNGEWKLTARHASIIPEK